MPRIRKKTSRRGTTHQREKIKHKATESRKKAKKEAKRNTQWKSKTPKDPGIPNNFPFKDQVLAEIAEERRKTAEEKAARKQANKSVNDNKKADAPATDDRTGTVDGEDVVEALAAATIDASRLTSSAKGKEKAKTPVVEDESTSGVSNPDLPHLNSVLDAAEVIIQVLDARDPQSYICPGIDDLASKKKTVYVLNKIDACPRESLSMWAAQLRQRHPTVYFRAASRFLPPLDNPQVTTVSKLPADDALGTKAVMSLLTHWAAEQTEGRPLTVAVVGLTNVGKSAFINSLARKAASLVYRTPSVGAPSPDPTTTLFPVEITIEVATHQIRFIDTPGLSLLTDADLAVNAAESLKANDILLRSKGRIDRMKNPIPCISQIVARANQQDLMFFYNLPAYPKDSADALLTTIARTQKLTKRGGVLDLSAAARVVLRDWAMGKFLRYTVPPKSSIGVSEILPASDVHLEDEKTLAQVPTRADRRKVGGLVRFSAATPDSRNVDLLAPWVREDVSVATENVEEEDAEEEDQDQEIDENEDDEDKDDVSVVDEDMSESEDPPVPQRKRKGVPSVPDPSAPPSKKVAFTRHASPPNGKSAVTGKAPLKSALKPAKAVKEAKGKGKTKTKVADARKHLASTADSVKQQKATVASKGGKKQARKSLAPAGDEGAYNFGEFF